MSLIYCNLLIQFNGLESSMSWFSLLSVYVLAVYGNGNYIILISLFKVGSNSWNQFIVNCIISVCVSKVLAVFISIIISICTNIILICPLIGFCIIYYVTYTCCFHSKCSIIIGYIEISIFTPVSSPTVFADPCTISRRSYEEIALRIIVVPSNQCDKVISWLLSIVVFCMSLIIIIIIVCSCTENMNC